MTSQLSGGGTGLRCSQENEQLWKITDTEGRMHVNGSLIRFRPTLSLSGG